MSPWSTLSLQQYVAILTSHQDCASLAYAATLARDHPLWMQTIVPKLNALPAPSVSNKTAETERGMQLTPKQRGRQTESAKTPLPGRTIKS